MQYIEYGRQNKEVVIFLHGGGLFWCNFREVAELLRNRYHVVLPGKVHWNMGTAALAVYQGA